jgi:signal transduction histidine kinase
VRRQFVSMAVAITSMVVFAFVLPLAFLVRTIAADRATSRANADAQFVAQVIAGRHASAASLAQADASAVGSVSVYYADGTVIGDRSHPPTADSLQLARQGRSFSRSTSSGVDVFLPVLEAAGRTAVIRVSVPHHELERGVVAAWLSLGGLGVALILLAGLVADRMARSVIEPMNTLTEIARRLADGDLDARSRVRGSAEVVEVSRALDLLAARIGDLLRAERDNAADLSHRLRTPLTALRLDAELLQDEDEAKRIMAAVDDLEAAVTSLIADTRRYRSSSERGRADLTDVVRERMAFWKILARAQQRPVDLCLIAEPLPVAGAKNDLQQLVDVLVDNVLRHTPSGRAMRVTTTARPGGGARFVIEDSGAGFRTSRSSKSRGSGRGLEIARRISRDSGGALTLGHSDLGGALIDVQLGPPTR